MRFHFTMMTAALLAVAGCASSPSHSAAPVIPATEVYEDGSRALPRYFSVTVSSVGVSALGQPVDEQQLQAWATREAADASVTGAAVTAESGVSETQALSVIGLLVRSGFKHVVFSSRDGLAVEVQNAPPIAEPVALVAPEPEPEPEPSEPTPEPAAAESAPSATEPPNVEVKQLGLHIGGGPNNEQAHAVYAKPIQRRFGELQRCYALATPTQKNASFGVDLLISTRGGTAKIKDYRTSLGGKEFHLCVLGVFGTVEFPARDKATMVSYSVLFKPL